MASVKSIEITNFTRQNEDGIYIDYIEGCFLENEKYSFLIVLKPTNSKYRTRKDSRISKVYLQDSTTPFGTKSKVWLRSYGDPIRDNPPTEEPFQRLMKFSLMKFTVQYLNLKQNIRRCIPIYRKELKKLMTNL